MKLGMLNINNFEKADMLNKIIQKCKEIDSSDELWLNFFSSTRIEIEMFNREIVVICNRDLLTDELTLEIVE